MKTASEIDRSLNQTLTILVSAIIHAGLMVGICCSATEQKEKPIAVATKLIELKTTPLPPSPKKETKKPEPPKPEPPKPEPPKPEPPKPQPPKPEPPKLQPPKPEPPKPPTPTPAVVKTDTPPKPIEQPKKLTRAEELRKQLESATVKKMDPQPRPQPQQTYAPPRPVQPVQTKSAEQYAKEAMARVSTDTRVNLPAQKGATVAEDSKNYAVNCAAGILYEHWNPSRAGMKSRNPSPVEISFMISIDGVVSNVRITKRSNDPVMTSSVEELVNQIKNGHIQFPSLASVGINRPFLQISITMYLKD